jgi:hypothetical protein
MMNHKGNGRLQTSGIDYRPPRQIEREEGEPLPPPNQTIQEQVQIQIAPRRKSKYQKK